MTAKRPASQYFWANWLSDAALQSCSLSARGLWHEMNCYMHQAEPYGHLYLNGKPLSAEKLANFCRISANTCRKLLQELEDAGVYSRDANSAIFSRRMVRDEVARESMAAAGRANGHKGAEFGKLGAEHGAKGGRPRLNGGGLIEDEKNPPLKPPQNPHSSSSSSSSTAVNTEKSASHSKRTPPAPFAKPVTVEPQTWADFMKVRAVKNSPMTATAWKGIEREAAKAGITVQAAVETCVERSWQGFKAAWLARDAAEMLPGFSRAPAARAPAAEPAWRTEQRERMRQAAPYAFAKPRPQSDSSPIAEEISDVFPPVSIPAR